MTQLSASDILAAGLTPKAWRDSSQDFVLAIDNSNGKAVYAGYPADVTITSWVAGTQLANQDVYTPGVGYKRTILAFDFRRGPLAGWYAATLAAKGISLFGADQVAALEGGVVAQATDCASFKATADAEIARLRGVYGRGPQVPEDRIVAFSMITLAGLVYAEMAKANRDAAAKGCPSVPFPEAAGASVSAGLNFPPPDGTIQLGTGEVPIGVALNSPSTPTRNEGPWPVGAHSAYTAPVGAFRAGQQAPSPFRFPNPQLWYGPAGTYSGINPTSGLPITADPNRDTGTKAPTPPVGGSPTGGPTPATAGPPAVSGPIPNAGTVGGGTPVNIAPPPIPNNALGVLALGPGGPAPKDDAMLPASTPSTVVVPSPSPVAYVLAGALILGLFTFLLTRKG